MSKNLTDKQQETLHAVEKYIADNSMPPTLSELQSILGVSSNQAVINHLNALEQKGYIERKKTARGIKVVKSTQDSADGQELLDILAEIAAKKQTQPTKKQNIISPSPFSAEDQSGKVIVGFYNNEQY